jgi:hypothetical protein
MEKLGPDGSDKTIRAVLNDYHIERERKEIKKIQPDRTEAVWMRTNY